MSDEFERLLANRERFEESLRRRAGIRGAPPVSAILRQFFDRTTEPMFITSSDGAYIMVNAAYGRLLGYSPQELLRIPVTETYALPAERRRFRGTIEGPGRAHGITLKLRSRGGAPVDVVVDAVVWRRDDQAIGGYMGVVRTARRLSSNRHELDVFDLAVKGANEGLWTWDLQTDEVRYSTRWKEMLGYEEHEIHNTLSEWTSRIHPADVGGYREALGAHLKRERDVFLSHFRMTHKDGTQRWVLARGLAEFGDDGKAVRIAGSLSNVSAHMQVIERLTTEGKMLQEKSREAEAQRDAFSRYLPEDLRSELVDRGEEQIHFRNSESAVLYVRVNEAAYYHAHSSADRFGEFLNEILSDVSDLIHGRRGVVARTEGDAVLALFGAFSRHAEDVDRAFATADAIRRYIATYNDVRDESAGPAVAISMGVSYGIVFTGTTGNVHRLDFNCYGAPIRRAHILQTRAAAGTLSIMADRSAASRASSDWCFDRIKLPTSDSRTFAYSLPENGTNQTAGCTDPDTE